MAPPGPVVPIETRSPLGSKLTILPGAEEAADVIESAATDAAGENASVIGESASVAPDIMLFPMSVFSKT